jgi:TonB family protein
MKTFFAFCYCALVINGISAQNTENFTQKNDSDKVYGWSMDIQQPKFSGNINKYITDSIRYPTEARKKNIEGTVYVHFIVEKNGSISNITILRSPDTLLNTEAKRVVATMPKWESGRKNGNPIRVQYNLPIIFKL